MSVCIYFSWKQFQYQLALGSLKMDVEGSGNAWRNGKYKSGDGGQDLITIDGEKVTFNAFNEAKLKFGLFNEADPKVVEMTGEKKYNIELSYDFVGRKMVDYGVLTENGTKLVFKGMAGTRTRVWITEEEAELIEKDGDPIGAPISHYKVVDNDCNDDGDDDDDNDDDDDDDGDDNDDNDDHPYTTRLSLNAKED